MTAPPQLSMLWEPVDPVDTLTTRFGFRDAPSAVGWVGSVLSDAWGITLADCERLVMSSGNLLAWVTTDRGRLIAKWSIFSWLFPRLADRAALAAWLHARGLPVAAPLPAQDGRLQVEVDNVSLGVYPVIAGDLLDVDAITQVTEAGQLLATLHEALAAYPNRLDGAQPDGDEQLIHNDFRSANILHDGMKITAVLDFEEVAYRTRVADLAKATVLLGTRYHGWGPTTPPVREAFLSAYRDRTPLRVAEEKELRDRVEAILKKFAWT